MRFAKLEMKSILAVLLSTYEFKLSAKDGALPEPDRNNLHTTRPKEPVFVSYNALPPHDRPL
jgi:cytochrome P450